jgi:ABC-type branched-subunit amino acid transport system substrate-binding protein
MSRLLSFLVVLLSLAVQAADPAPAPAPAADTVRLGFNYPRTGPYFAEGLDQLRAAQMAVEEVNAAGGILGKQVELVIRDSQSKADVTKKNVTELIDEHHVKMVFGGSASNVAVAAGEVCEQKGIPFFGTLTYSNATTGSDGHRHTFRECYSAWMGAKVLGKYLREHFPAKKYFYITADYTWGATTEESMRVFTGTTDTAVNQAIKTPFPTAVASDFKKALDAAEAAKPEVLVLVLFGQDMVNAVNMAAGRGMKDRMQIVVPNLTMAMAEAAGAKNMAGVLGAVPWSWKIPYKYNYKRGIKYVEDFSAKYHRYPSTSGASAYTIVYEFKAAAERAGSLEAPAIIKALEGHTYQLLKDEQTWRDFDHQSIQTVYAVRCNQPEVVAKDKYKLDLYEILDVMSGAEAAKTKKEWIDERTAAGKPPFLEKLPGEK